MNALLGETVLQLCNQASNEVVLVSPFIKYGVMERVFNSLGDSIDFRCVTRWKVSEIVSGVSDIEIWELVRSRSQTSLWLRSNLHAKYFRFDDVCLVGSANLTSSGLGWSPRPNLELLVRLDRTNSQLAKFEEELFEGSIQVTSELFVDLNRTLEGIPEHSELRQDPVTAIEPHSATSGSGARRTPIQGNEARSPDQWIPYLRHPEKLYLAYQGKSENLSVQAREAAAIDLAFLQPPPGLDRVTFQAHVVFEILQSKVFQKVDGFLDQPRRFGEVADYISSIPGLTESTKDSKFKWQTMMRWLLHFFPERYERSMPRYSEIFMKRDVRGD